MAVWTRSRVVSPRVAARSSGDSPYCGRGSRTSVGAVLIVGEEGLLGVGAWVAFEVVGGRGCAVFAEEFFGALGYW